jgi:hypothetical protein
VRARAAAANHSQIYKNIKNLRLEKNPEKLRKTQKSSEKLRKAQKSSEKLRKTQKRFRNLEKQSLQAQANHT